MTTQQQGDVLIVSGLETEGLSVTTGTQFTLEIENGVIVMTGGFETAALLSLFGGNVDDDGSASTLADQYWGNLIETLPERRLRSRTQHLLQSTPATSANLRRIEEAARLDLAWFLELNVADTVEITASIPALNRIALSVFIAARGKESNFTFTLNWKTLGPGVVPPQGVGEVVSAPSEAPPFPGPNVPSMIPDMIAYVDFSEPSLVFTDAGQGEPGTILSFRDRLDPENVVYAINDSGQGNSAAATWVNDGSGPNAMPFALWDSDTNGYSVYNETVGLMPFIGDVAFSWFAVFLQDMVIDVGNFRRFARWGSVTEDEGYTPWLGEVEAGPSMGSWEMDNDDMPFLFSTGAPAPISSPGYIYADYRIAGGLGDWRVNRGEWFLNEQTVTGGGGSLGLALTQQPGQLWIGGPYPSNTWLTAGKGGWQGRLVEFGIYERSINDTERTNIRNYLKARYGLASGWPP
jgi:phage gp46-like protein